MFSIRKDLLFFLVSCCLLLHFGLSFRDDVIRGDHFGAQRWSGDVLNNYNGGVVALLALVVAYKLDIYSWICLILYVEWCVVVSWLILDC